MKICIIGDIHWSQFSSIVRKMGDNYSCRLENLIQSINWAEQLAVDNNCDKIIYLGDFFDKAECNSMEITALKEIKWNELPHYFIVGNHEAGRGDLAFNSADLFRLRDSIVFNAPQTVVNVNDNKYELCFLPYIKEENRKPIKEYFKSDNPKIIFSHNDIKGFQMGQFVSKEGFDIDDIEANCVLCFNGHLHNGGKVSSKIINVGNLSGQNFSEDAFKYDHTIIILDTNDLSCAVYENPFAFNFYHLDFVGKDIDYINDVSMKMKKNCVATINCYEKDLEYLRARFDPKCRQDNVPYNCNMIESRFIIQPEPTNTTITNQEELISINHLDKFKEYMIDTYGNSNVMQQELYEVCKE